MIVGITGYKGSGKSTLAHVLIRRGFVRLRMAGVLKDMLRVMGLTDAQIDGNEKELPCDLLGGRTPRHAMQTLGTEWGRNLICDDLWVRTVKLRIDRLQGHASNANVVIDDIRFFNERDMIKSYAGGVLWRVIRPGLESDDHVSEAYISKLKVDRVIFNHGTIADLEAQI